METEIKTLVAAMRELAATIQSDDGIANAAIAEAARRLDQQALYIVILEETIKEEQKKLAEYRRWMDETYKNRSVFSEPPK